MSNALARRGFLRGLAHLPLVGGAVTILGSPTAAAEPVTTEMLWSYKTFLDMEHRHLAWEMRGSYGYGFRELMRVTVLDNPAGRFHGTDERPPSTRAAVVLSAVGCGWRDTA